MCRRKIDSEIEKKMLIQKTLNEINKQIEKLEKQKKSYIDLATEAKKKGLSEQYDLALSALKITLAQLKKVNSMKLNFEITLQMRDMTQMTTDFLQGMDELSKGMLKMTKNQEFKGVSKRFKDAMSEVADREGKLEVFLKDTASEYKQKGDKYEPDGKALEEYIANEAENDDLVDDQIQKELEELKKKMN